MATPPSPRHSFQDRVRNTLLLNKTAVITRGSIIVAVAATLTLIIVSVLHSNNMNTPPRPTISSNTPHTANPAIPSPTLGSSHIGSNAPNFTLSTLAGDQNVSLSDYYGKPVLLNFWSLDCSDCLKETPIIQRYYTAQRAQGKDLVILGINMDMTDNFIHVAQFQVQHGLTYPILVDDHYQAKTLAQARTLYHVTSVPTSFFIDRQGIIRAIMIGSLDTNTLHKDTTLIEVMT